MADPRAFKIVILGQERVGKTSLLKQYVTGTFDANESSTLTAAYVDKLLTLRGTPVRLSLWDTAGQERFRALAPIYYRGAHGALLVYDVTDVESFRRVEAWVEELHATVPQCPLAVVGNKIDLRARVSLPDAEAYARSIGARHSLASARLGQGVNEAFQRLAEDVLDSGARGGERGTRIVPDGPSPRRHRCCHDQ